MTERRAIVQQSLGKCRHPGNEAVVYWRHEQYAIHAYLWHLRKLAVFSRVRDFIGDANTNVDSRDTNSHRQVVASSYFHTGTTTRFDANSNPDEYARTINYS